VRSKKNLSDGLKSSIQTTKSEGVVGSFVVVYSVGHGRYAARVLAVDAPNRQIRYKIMSGPRKGSIVTGEYVPDRPIKVYDEFSAVKALLRT